MDMAKRVDYEFLYKLELVDPGTDEPTGVVFMLRSASSDHVEKVIQTHTNRNIERRVKGKLVTAETLKQQELEKAAAMIASWEWGEQKFNGVVPELKLGTAVEVLKVGWIYDQVTEASGRTSNFIQG